MSSFDEIKQFLPKYLSQEATASLFQELENFPNNINKRLYSDVLYSEGDVFQGDGLRDMLIVKLPDTRFGRGPVIVMSNTCDTSFSNTRLSTPKIVYCPIIRLSVYIDSLRKESVSGERLLNYSQDIRKQKISSLFYLPKGARLPDECVALFDGVNSCDVSVLDPERVVNQRLFSLSNYGFYLFLFKLSIHFTRIREVVDRT